MNSSKKKLCATLAIAVVLVIAFVQMPEAFSTDSTVQAMALSAIRDIVGLDTAKYSVNLSRYHSDNPADYGGLLREDMLYSLKSDGNRIDFAFRFVNKTLAFVDISPYNCSLLSAYYVKQMPTNVLDATKAVLQRLQTYQDAFYIQPMRNSMDSVTDINSANATIGNLKRLVTVYTNVVSKNVTSTSTSIYFMYTVNGADSPKSVNIQFRDGALTAFSNGWKFFSVGNENVRISREEAISIAREQANNATTTPLKYADRPVRADLHLQPREPFTLYPFWFVELPLNYPNSTVTGWQVGIWADTGKIAYSHPTGIMGSIPNTDSFPSAPTSTPLIPSSSPPVQESNENQPITMYVIAVSAILSIIVAVAVVAVKRRLK